MKTLKERIEESRKYLNEFKARTSLSLHELVDIEEEFSNDYPDEDDFQYIVEGISGIDNTEEEEDDEN